VTKGSSVNLALLPILLLFSIRTVSRNSEWNNEMRIYESALRVCPTSVKALSNYGMLQLGKLGGLDSSLTHSLRALQVHADQPPALVNAGIAYGRMGRYFKAVNSFERF
jgi:tetratricopeptide (TPR) repeat protein